MASIELTADEWLAVSNLAYFFIDEAISTDGGDLDPSDLVKYYEIMRKAGLNYENVVREESLLDH